MNAMEIDTAALRRHADRIESSHPTIAARARRSADRIGAERAAKERDDLYAYLDGSLGGFPAEDNRTDAEKAAAARVACFLGIGPKVCTCGRTDGKHGLLCGIR